MAKEKKSPAVESLPSMTQSFDANPIEQDLLALVDGELDDAGLWRIQQLLMEPAGAERISEKLLGTLMLKQRLNMCMRQQTPLPDAALKNQVRQMLSQVGHDDSVTPSAVNPSRSQPSLSVAVAGSRGNERVAADTSPAQSETISLSGSILHARWLPTGIAAVLLAGVMLSLGTIRSGFWSIYLHTPRLAATNIGNAPSSAGHDANGNELPLVDSESRYGGALPSTRPSVSAQGPDASSIFTPLVTASPEAPVTYAQLSTDQISAFTSQHTRCSRRLQSLYRSGEFPTEVAKMPKAIAGCIGKKPCHSLDLSRLGYHFSRAGECQAPGRRSVHLVYRDATEGDSISLWVVDYTGRPQIQPGILYQGDPADAPHPIFFWRQDDLLFYLVGDSFDLTRTAAQILAMATQ
jgi:hypothetical protein